MRKSVRKNDIGYDPKACNFTVYLDGKKLEHCFTADEEREKAWCHRTYTDGNFVFGKKEKDRIDEICYEGKVEIKKDVINEK